MDNQVKSVGIAIVWNDHILLVHHPKAKKFEKTLSIPKGRQEKNEIGGEVLTAIREVKEEVGIDIPFKWLMDQKIHSVYNSEGREIQYYIVNVKDLKHLELSEKIIPKNQLQEEEVDWAGFIPLSEAYSSIIGYQKPIIIEAGFEPEVQKEELETLEDGGKVSQEIIDPNLLIAEFMGFEQAYKSMPTKNYLYRFDDEGNELHYQISNLKYDTSWDWLMPVVEKIENIKDVDGEREYSVTIKDEYIAVTHGFDYIYKVYGLKSKKSKIASLYEAVVAFIIWYNEKPLLETPVIDKLNDGGIIEGQLHSECNDETGCGEKFKVDGVRTIEAEREEAVITDDAFDTINCPIDGCIYEIKGTCSQIASALNVMGGGKNFDEGAEVLKGDEVTKEAVENTPEAINTDVDRNIDGGSIIINRRSMADPQIYIVKGTPRQIASLINSNNGNGVEIEKGGTLKKA